MTSALGISRLPCACCELIVSHLHYVHNHALSDFFHQHMPHRHCSRLSDRTLAFFCYPEEVASASLQHPRANQFIDGVEYASPFGWFVACGLEQYMQVQPIFPHFSE
jgi:hypothetical protein